MAQLDVGTLNMTIQADGSAAIQELDRVKRAAGGAAEDIAEGFAGAGDGLDGVAEGASGAASAMDKAGDAGAAAGQKIEGGAKKATASLKGVGEMMSNVGKMATVALTTPIVGALTAAVKGASDLTETVGKAEVVFDRMSDKVLRWSEDSVRAMGLAQGSALEYASTYGDMATGMGLSIEKSAEMSMRLTQLAADMASFKNIRTDVAAQKLNAVFTGETEGLKSMGIVMTQANLQAFALSQGITTQVSKLTQAEQVMLRYQYVMNATKNAQGDFVRTGDSLANQSRKLTETLKQAGESFGALLTPAVTAVVERLQGIVQGIAQLDEGAKRMILSAAMAVAAVGPVLLVGGKLISMIVSLQGAIAALSLNPVIVALAAVAALGAAFVGFNKAMNGANDEATRATDSYQRMKNTVEGGVDTKVTVDTTELDDVDGSSVTVNINANGEDAIAAAEALVTDIQTNYRGQIEINGSPEEAERALEKIKSDIAHAKAALAIDGNPKEAEAAVEELKRDIDLLEGMVAITEDPATKAALNDRIADLRREVQNIVGSVTFTVSGQSDLEHYRETLEKLPKDETFHGYGVFTISEGTNAEVENFKAALGEAVGAVGDYKNAVEQLKTLADQNLQESIRQVYVQTTEQAERLVSMYKQGQISQETYIEGLKKLNEDRNAQIQQLTDAFKAETELYDKFNDGVIENDVPTWAEVLENRYDAGKIDKEVTPERTATNLTLIDQSEDRSKMQLEGAEALVGLQEKAEAQYESLTAAVEQYSQAQAEANQQQESAETASKLAEDYGSMTEAARLYSDILDTTNDAQFAFDSAMALMGENADPAAIQALSDALHDADGSLTDYNGSLNAVKDAQRLQGEASQQAADAEQAVTEKRAQALSELQASLQEIQDGGLTSADAEQALIQIDETGVDISGAQTALITGVPAAVEEAMEAANAAAETGENPMDTLAAAVGASAGVVESATGQAVTTAIGGAAGTAQSQSSQIGENLMSGAKSGVMAKAGDLARAAAQAVRDAIKAAKAAEESASPSKVAMREIGAPLMQGAEIGIVRETPKVLTTMKKSVSKLISGAAAVSQGASFAATPAMAVPGMQIDYDAMGKAMRGAMSGVRFSFGVNGRELAESTREETSGQMAFRADQVNRGYGVRT